MCACPAPELLLQSCSQLPAHHHKTRLDARPQQAVTALPMLRLGQGCTPPCAWSSLADACGAQSAGKPEATEPAVQAFSKSTGGDIWFGLPVTATMSSVVTLTVNADSLALVTNQSPGQVISATMCTFNNATCGGFTALNQRGYLTVVLRNSGYIAASYTVQVLGAHHAWGLGMYRLQVYRCVSLRHHACCPEAASCQQHCNARNVCSHVSLRPERWEHVMFLHGGCKVASWSLHRACMGAWASASSLQWPPPSGCRQTWTLTSVTC